MSLSDFQIL